VFSQREQTEQILMNQDLTLVPLSDAPDRTAFEDLFNLEDIQHLQDLFARACGVASVITHVDGTPITRPSNFCSLCMDIIRKTEKGLKNCYCSDAIIGRHNPSGPVIQPCLSGGLWDAGSSITVGGRHIANWLIGQVRNESQNEEKMAEYAREIGADEQAFREAYRNVPVMSRERFEKVADVLFVMASQLSNGAYQNIQQARFITEQKRAEERVRQLADYQSTLLDNAPYMVISSTEEGVITTFNRAAERTLGYTSEECIGKLTPAIFHDPKEVAERAKILSAELGVAVSPGFEVFAAKARRRLPDENEWIYIRKDGARIPVLLSVTALRDPHDKIIGFIGISSDITERKQAEKALNKANHDLHLSNAQLETELGERRLAEQRILRLAEQLEGVNHVQGGLLGAASLEAKLLCVTEGVVKYLGADFCRVWLIRPGGRCADCVHAETAEGQHVCRERSKCLHLVASSGRYTHTDGRIHRRVPFGCYKIGMVASGANHKFLIEDAVNDPRVHNRDWARELGLVSFAGYQIRVPGEESIGVLAMFSKHPLQPVEDAMLGSLSSAVALMVRQTDAEAALRKSNDQLELRVQERTAELTRANDQMRLEIAERRRAEGERAKAQAERDTVEGQLRQAQKLEAVGQLAAGIAHEINTPAQYVGDNTQFLRDSFESIRTILRIYDELLCAARENRLSEDLVARVEKDLDDADLAYLFEHVPSAIQGTLDGVERVTKIVRAMKEFSHPGSREKDLADLNRAIETTTTVARNEWKYVAELELDLAPDLPSVSCFVGEFNQCILNLVINAAHAIGDTIDANHGSKGKIRVCTRQVGDFVEVRVQDTGAGIPASIRHRIFEPFFTTKEVGRGTGQGLSIVYGTIVKRHGGTVTFETEEGKGTTFVIRLPVGTPPEEN
jgi:PAS domain S-box-containing protein